MMTPHSTGRRRSADTRRYRYELPARAASVPESRRLASGQLARWALGDDVTDTVLLMISELFTNAVVHTASEVIVCELRYEGDRLMIEVQDQGGGRMPADRRRVPDDECGRGLLLVGALSTAWGSATPCTATASSGRTYRSFPRAREGRPPRRPPVPDPGRPAPTR
ncbi:ATP-binding protein [Streptomyces sp. M19]